MSETKYPRCEGRKWIMRHHPKPMAVVECPTCRGTGKLDAKQILDSTPPATADRPAKAGDCADDQAEVVVGSKPTESTNSPKFLRELEQVFLEVNSLLIVLRNEWRAADTWSQYDEDVWQHFLTMHKRVYALLPTEKNTQ